MLGDKQYGNDVTVCGSDTSFIEKMADERNEGLGFVPLIGTGLSAPSGIPILRELAVYLQRCIAIALGINSPFCWDPENTGRPLNFSQYRRWLPGRDQWPPFGGPQILHRDNVQWDRRLQAVVAEIIHRSDTEFEELSVFQEAFGAMAEWRSSLLFLSRLRYSHDGRTLMLRDDDADILDTFFLSVLEGKRPTLGHRMLARLGVALRASPILTTNFDDLLEQAFSEINHPLTPFDVHVESGLPSFRDMVGRNCIVKLHGGRYGLRADYSLDATPSDSDFRHFVEYLLGRPVSDSEWWDDDTRFHPESPESGNRFETPRLRVRRHLFVIGCGAKDERILRFIQVASRRTKDLQIFWLCYSQEDEESAAHSLERVLAGGNAKASIFSHHAFGLFFLQLYQQLMHSLPSSGVVFPHAPRLPVPPEWRNDVVNLSEVRVRKFTEEISRLIDEGYREDEGRHQNVVSDRYRFVLVTNEYGTLNGVTTALARLFHQQLEDSRQAIWIDLDEAKSTDDLFEMLVHTISRKTGIVDWLPVLVHKQHVLPANDRACAFSDSARRLNDLQVREIARLTNNPNRQWVVFLNGRSGAGRNLEDDFGDLSHSDHSNGWLDLPGPNSDPSFDDRDDSVATANGPYLVQLLKRLTGPECPNLTVILDCYDGPFVGFCDDALPERLSLRRPTIPEKGFFQQNNGDASRKSANDIADSAIELAKADEAMAQFLYAMCLTNRPRYPALLWSRAFHGDVVSQKRFQNTEIWLDQLAKKHVVRRKLGGFIWMHCEIRNALRERLPRECEYLYRCEESLHRGLSECFWRLFLASDDPLAAFEAVYHQFHHIRCVLEHGNDELVNEIPHRLEEVRHMFDAARPAMLSIGFSKGVCRWLAYCRESVVSRIRKQLDGASNSQIIKVRSRCIDLLQVIEIHTVRLQRDIGREVGENAIAAKRHRDLRRLQAIDVGVIQRTPENYVLTHRGEVDANGQEDEEVKEYLERILDHLSTTESTEPILNWIDSETQLGTLGIAARSFTFAASRFRRVYETFHFPGPLLLGTPADKDAVRSTLNGLREWYHQRDSGFGRILVDDLLNEKFQVVMGIVKSLGRDLQLRLVWGQLLHLCSRRDLKDSSGSPIRKAAALEHIQFGHLCHVCAVSLSKWVNQQGEALTWGRSGYFIRRDDLRAWYDERQRLDTQHSIILAYQGDFDKAHRRLNEAEASSRRSTVGHSTTEQAILELHRAEVLTLQACFQPKKTRSDGRPRTTPGKERPLTKIRRMILEDYRKKNFHDILDNYLTMVPFESAVGRPYEQRIRDSLAFIEDAWQALDRAGRLLDRQRKNVWWTTWYFDLRMKLIELRTFAALVEKSDAIPHLGLESVPLGYPTLADELIDASRRMVRFDVFRFAHTAESYAHSLLAFTLWRQRLQLTNERLSQSSGSEDAKVTREADRINAFLEAHLIRQHDMAGMLVGDPKPGDPTAQATIRLLLEERELLYDQRWPTSKLEPQVKIYVNHVLNEITHIHRYCSGYPRPNPDDQ